MIGSGIGSGPIGFEGDDYVESRNLVLESLSPTAVSDTPNGSFETKKRDELDADTPALNVDGPDAGLFTQQRTDFESSTPNASTTTPDATLQLGVPLTIVSPPAGNVNPGDLVSIVITGNPTSLSSPAGIIAIQSLDGQGNLTFLAPEPPSFGDQTETYNEAIPLTLVQDNETAEFDLVVEPPPAELFGQIESIHPDGIYANDTLAVGDWVHIKNITGDGTINVATGEVMVGTTAFSFDYAIYDGVWSGYATESFEAPSEPLNLDVSGNETVNVSTPAGTLETTAGLGLAASTPIVDASGNDATLETSGALELDATAPTADVSGNEADLETTQGLALDSTTPSAVANYIDATLDTKGSLELESDTPSIDASGNTASLQTGRIQELEATTPDVDATTPDASIETSEELALDATTPEVEANTSGGVLQTGNLDFIEPANTVIVEVAPMATVKHDGVNIPDWPAKDPDADIWNGIDLDFLAADDPIIGYSILINDQAANDGETVDGLTLLDKDSDLLKTVTARLAGGTFGERYKVTVRYSTNSIPSDDKSAYLRIINQ